MSDGNIANQKIENTSNAALREAQQILSILGGINRGQLIQLKRILENNALIDATHRNLVVMGVE